MNKEKLPSESNDLKTPNNKGVDLKRLVSFTVTKQAMRPASEEERCFYCKQSIGDMHKDDCVLISKNIKVRMVIEYIVRVPAHWEKDDIEFHRNESSWCCNNAIDELREIFTDNTLCMCDSTEFEYLSDASEPYLHE